jgi:hypothetical protein
MVSYKHKHEKTNKSWNFLVVSKALTIGNTKNLETPPATAPQAPLNKTVLNSAVDDFFSEDEDDGVGGAMSFNES